MKCFYHNADLDGICSAAIVHQRYPNAELIGINYGDPFPWDDIVASEEIWMVDFSLQPFEDMAKLARLCTKNDAAGDRTSTLHWVDHHKTAIEEWQQQASWPIKGLLRDGIGACALVWDYIHCIKDCPEHGNMGPRPRAVELLARYDVWDHEDPDTLPFQYGMRVSSAAGNPLDGYWKYLLAGPEQSRVRECVDDGATILDYIDNDNALKARALCFDHNLLMAPDGLGFHCLRCLAANFGPTNSKFFDSKWDSERYDAMLLFSYRPKNKLWTISLYTDRDDVDVSQVAKAYGGGGHKGAAGFQVTHLSEIGL